MAAAADAGSFEVIAIAIGENLPDQSAVGINVEAYRRVGIVDVLRPAFDAARSDTIDIAAQRAEALKDKKPAKKGGAA